MKFEAETRQKREFEVASVLICVPVEEVEYSDQENGNKKWPDRFGYQGDDVVIQVDADTGKIKGWPGGEYDGHWKPRDNGRYFLLDAKGGRIAGIECDYVPGALGMNDGGGDYLVVAVSADGTIAGFVETFTPYKVARDWFEWGDDRSSVP